MNKDIRSNYEPLYYTCDIYIFITKVLYENAKVYNKPFDRSLPIINISKGHKYKLLCEFDGWMKIEYEQSPNITHIGWINKRDIIIGERIVC